MLNDISLDWNHRLIIYLLSIIKSMVETIVFKFTVHI